MTLNEYQQQAMTTCLPEAENFTYMMLNLVGEVGEFASKVAKTLRKGQITMRTDADLHYHISLSNEEIEHYREELMKEAGDILWQLSGLCAVNGWWLEDVAQQNLDKLADRKSRQVIDGSGDNR